ncbi:MAG: hypothetical protein MPEBLZ_01800 [Candidatus Methanoperedens nitroreducens]|uniref:Uncharacterized protein n=1 Tax=Candidatus Methanoperedens nitratireducens TaxID=1392998 RepID=A0A0P7ZIM6_9EURY|nr:hypothetical protein [Candidatus Methanoperedens sp. BLZ2]KPQ43617.1 MAG: hypothetical protein MPEBLZ_01800 [Candidatus Methanoperedens sp. BLZ1]MBZ0174454.1 hypothetical protein [Candidatus Methanoperedens nitroreducens]MCX9078474.1 hypothetical protein [Candidatus Methanoperedens sp.]
MTKDENIKTIHDALPQFYSIEELKTYDELRLEDLASNVRAQNRTALIESAYIRNEKRK